MPTRDSRASARAIVRLASFVLLVFTTGCAHGGFDRFMEHPILSWLPLDKWGVVGKGKSRAKSMQFSDTECLQVARERTEFLDRSEFDDADFRKVFVLTYQDCVKWKR